MHVRSVSKIRPVEAQNIEAILDIILQIINVVEALQRVFGFDIGQIIGKKE